MISYLIRAFLMTIREIDILYQPDPTKKKLLEFNTPEITINNSSVSIGQDGFISNLNISDNVNINISVYVYDALSTDKTPTTLDDEEYNYSIVFSLTPTTSIPQTLSLTDNGDGTCSITGYISKIDYEKYEFLIRASLIVTDKNTNTVIRTDDTDYYVYFLSTVDENFYWNLEWLASLPYTTNIIDGTTYTIYNIGKFPKGANVDIGVSLQNNSNKNIKFSYESTNIDGISSMESILPENLRLYKIDNTDMSIGGNIDLQIDTSSGNVPYYFKLIAQDENDPTSYGNPDTRNTIFEIDILNYFSGENTTSNMIIWETPSGKLGTSYERYDSHFSVSAYNPDNNTVSFQLSPNGNSLPDGIYIDSSTGMLLGKLPSVSEEINYVFTIRAICGNQFSDRTFYITILPLYGTGSYIDIYIPFTYLKRILATSFAWNTICVPTKNVFRDGDSNFGRIVEPMIYFISGLSDIPSNTGYWKTLDSYGEVIDRNIVENLSDQSEVDQYSSCFLDKLKNYHKPFNLTINGLNYSPCYDPDGVYIYDVVYLTLTDNDENDYRFFDNSNTEQTVYLNYEYQQENRRFFTSSIRNCRLDLIQVTNRQLENSNMTRPGDTPGMGLLQNEGLPMWMMTNNPNTNTSLGYVCCVPLVYTTPGYGKTAVIEYTENNIDSLFGITFTVDGYLVNFYSRSRMHFDLNTETNTETTFDVVNNSSGTWFDVNYTSETKYILFPEENLDGI